MGGVAAASYLVSCLPVVLSAAVAESVVKCCPQGLTITVDKTCVPGNYIWSYANITYGMPNCETEMIHADRDVQVSCTDYSEQKRTFVGLICMGNVTSEKTFAVPDINRLRKCCPKGRSYSSSEQSCWSEDVAYDERTEQYLLNIILSGSPGLIDLAVGAPFCGDGVLVDHLIPQDNVWREESESIRFREKGSNRSVIVNPDDICIDFTERQKILIVRVCMDPELICSQRLCIRKCCPDGEIYSNKNCTKYSGHSGPRLAFKLLQENISVSEVAYFYGDPCDLRGKYIEKSEVLLSSNGSMYYPSISQYVDNTMYCFEHIENTSTSIAEDSLMVCFEDQLEETNYKYVIQSVAMLVSCIFLLITLVVYCALPSLHQNIHGKTLICYIGCLICGYVCLSSVQLAQDFFTDTTCLIFAFSVQFTFLAAFAWLNVIGFDIWWTFGSLRSPVGGRSRAWRRFLLYSLFAWGLPSLVSAVTLFAEFTDYLPEEFKPDIVKIACFFSGMSNGGLLFFTVPVAIMITANVIFFWLTAQYCIKVKSELEKMRHSACAERKFQADKNRLVRTVKLFVVMGVNWIMELISLAYPEMLLWYLTDFFNALHGAFIFAVFVLKRDVQHNLKKRCSCLFCGSTEARKQSVSSTMITFITLSTGVQPDAKTIIPLTELKKKKPSSNNNNRLKP